MSTDSELLTAYIAAEKAILSGQSYSIGDRQLRRADLQWVQKERLRLQAVVGRTALGGSGAPRVKRAVPRDS